MKPSLTKKSFLRTVAPSDPLLPLLSLLLICVPLLLGRVSFSDLRITEGFVAPRELAAAVPSVPANALFFHVTLGNAGNLTELVEEATGKRISRLKLPPGKTSGPLLRTEFRRLQRKYEQLDTVFLRTDASVPYDTFVTVLAAFQAPSPDRAPPLYRPPQVVLIPSDEAKYSAGATP